MNGRERGETIFTGVAAAPGVAQGAAFVFIRRELEVPKRLVPPEKREEEISRFEIGLLETRKQISVIRAEIEEKLGEEEAAIFDAHLLVLEDRALIEETIREVIESGFNIEYSFNTVADRYIQAFSRIDDEYIKERVTDIRDVSRRLLFNLMGKREAGLDRIEKDNVLVADDLAPSDTVRLGLGSIQAVVTELGSRTSHSVIMARSLNVPCVVGIKDISHLLSTGDTILVDGFEGRVILNPSEATVARYGKLRSERRVIEERFLAAKNEVARHKDSRAFVLRLNVEGNEPDDILLNSGAEGVGLFRTEMFFLASSDYPTEEQQFQAYKRVVERLAPRPVTIRTLDLGGDKNPHHTLNGYRESNPFMGFRAIRFCLDNPEVFREQLRAILRASAYGKVKIMYPMIACVEEVLAANAHLQACKDELLRAGIPFDPDVPVGTMIEIPSAALVADLLAEHCDFFSVGTNDLIQYMLAVDRVNDRIAHLYQPGQPAILRILKLLVDAAKHAGVPVSVCGELAGDPRFAALLIGLGADELSLSWSAVAEVKYLLRRVEHADLRALAAEAMRLGCYRDVHALLDRFYERALGIPAAIKL